MKLATALGLALSAILAQQGLANGFAPPGADSPEPRIARQMDDLQSAILEDMRALDSADRQRRMARLSADMNAYQETVLQGLR